MAMSMAGIAVYSSVDCSVPWLVLWRTRAQTAAYSIAGYCESLAMGRGICCRFNDLQCRALLVLAGSNWLRDKNLLPGRLPLARR